jgi:predicted RNA methylase
MERIVFDKMRKNKLYHFVLNVHLQLYIFAHRVIYNKKIIDAACGTGFGTMIFSTAAKRILAVDKSQKAIDYAQKKLPFFCPVKFKKVNLETDILPEADVCVSLETIEHLKDTFFLENLNVDKLVYSLPIDMSMGVYHKHRFKTAEDAIAYVKSGGWRTTTYWVGENNTMMAIATRR